MLLIVVGGELLRRLDPLERSMLVVLVRAAAELKLLGRSGEVLREWGM